MSVSISGDGSLLAVGAPQSYTNILEKGYVQTFKNISGVWTKLGNDLSGDLNGDKFGTSVSLSTNGSKLAVGAAAVSTTNPPDPNIKGYTKVYELKSGAIWSPVGQKLVSNSGDINISVKLSGDGNILSCANIGNDIVKIYNMNGMWWQQLGNDILGNVSSLSINYNGNIVAIGDVFGSKTNTYMPGHVRIYQNITGNSWTKIGNTIEGKINVENFGNSVSLSHDGKYIAVGALNKIGRAGVYDLSSTLSSNSFLKEVYNLYPNPTKDIVTISNSENIPIKQVEIYDLGGKFIKTHNLNNEAEIQLNVEPLTSGTYLLHLQTNEGTAIKKLIKK